MTVVTRDWPVRTWFVVLSIAIVAFTGLVGLDHGTRAAQARDVKGAFRGAILARNGQPLAVTSPGTTAGTRSYALPDLATLLGYRDPSGVWHGLEARYNALLSGQQARSDWKTFFLHLLGQSVHGGSIQTTLDPSIQAAAQRALGTHMGAVVALDPRTGGVLAMVSQPTCSTALLTTGTGLARCENRQDRPLVNRPLDLKVAPGSSFKIVTLTAALDSGRFSLQSIFHGVDVFGPSPYFNGTDYPSNVTNSALTQLNLEQALAFSDNFTFAHIGLTIGAQTLLRYAHRYYLGRRIPFDLPVAVSTVAEGETHPGLSVLARTSFGARTDMVTPLQMAMIAAGAGNGGLLMAPHLVSQTRSPGGRVLWHYANHPLARVMSAATARQVATAMIFDVTSGSGWPAQINGVQVAGKTGTAASGKDRPHAWFIAFAPAYHPVIAVAVLREFSGEGLQYAAPVARQVLLAGLRQAGYKGNPGKPSLP